MAKIDILELELKQLKQAINCQMDEVMTIRDVAVFLKVSEWSVYQGVKNGTIPMTRKFGDYRILKSKLVKSFENK